MSDQSWLVLVHGGAKEIAAKLHQANREGCRVAAEAAAEVLRSGGSAVAAAEAAVRSLEDDPVFNAGMGSVRNIDGDVEMDAALMDGETLDVGAVAAVRRVRNPISAAAKMLREAPVLLVAEGAEGFASEAGLTLVDPSELTTDDPIASEAGHDTVGCVVMDGHGHVAAATSTGGLHGTRAGRVGDSPIPGAGLYADDRAGAVALSGDGEKIMRTILAARVMRSLEDGAAADGAAGAIDVLERVGGEAGAIVIDRDGNPGVAHNSAHFAIGLASPRGAAWGVVHRDEFWSRLHGE